MLSLKHSVSCFFRASSSRSALRSSRLLARRFYAEDNSKNGDRRNVYASLLNLNQDKNVVDELLDSPRQAVPDQPPRAPFAPFSNHINPAPPVGGKARFELPQRAARENTESLEGGSVNISSLPDSKAPEEEEDEAARRAKAAFQGDGKKLQLIPSTVTYRLYAMARSKNCIMTLVNEDYRRVAKISSGLLKFKNAAEGSYEAGYQCAIFMFREMRNQIAARDGPVRLEIFLNGFGQGRSALLKALTMPEGDGVRENVSRLTDTTPIKIGGVRLQKRRRL